MSAAREDAVAREITIAGEKWWRCPGQGCRRYVSDPRRQCLECSQPQGCTEGR